MDAIVAGQDCGPGVARPKCPSEGRCSTSERTAILCHPQTLLREGLARIVDGIGFKVIPARSMAEANRIVSTRSVDLVLVSKDSFQDAPAQIAELHEAKTGPVIAVLAPAEPQDDIAAVLQAGAYGYLSLNLTPEELDRSLALLAERDIVVSRDLTEDFSNAIGGPAEGTTEDRLSQREREVLGLVAEGKTNREIAHELIVTESTVKVHLRNVLDKLNLRNRQQAAAYAAREGLLDGANDSELAADTEQA